MLDLSSAEWSHLRASAGGDGRLTAHLLTKLAGGDTDEWAELHHQVCHQNTVGEVAYVAAPHMVEIARGASPYIRAQLLSTLGAIEASRKTWPEHAPTIRAEWQVEYERACENARALAADGLRHRGEQVETFLLLGALAGLHGHADLAMLLQLGPDLSCPVCGDPIEFRESLPPAADC